MTLVGVDVGGGGIRVLTDRGLRVTRAQAVHTGSTIDIATLAEAISAEVARVVDRDARIDVLVIGMTGFPDLFPEPARVLSAISDRVAAERVAVAVDALTAHVGALGFASGAVVAAGTGAVALGTDLERCWRRVDGWGHLLGDAGSGAWIGRRGLQAALRAVDGRAGGSVLLSDLMRERFGSIRALVGELYESDAPSQFTARFTTSVAEAARAGDDVAREIWRAAARALADTTVAALAGLPQRCSWTGGVFAADDLIRLEFEQAVHRRMPGAVVQPPSGDPVDGALRLAQAAAEGWRADAPQYVLFSDER